MINGGQRVVLGAAAAMVVLISVRSIATQAGMPAPNRYFGGLVLFSLWYVLAAFSPGLGGTFAAGTVVSGLLAPYAPGGTGNSPLSQLAQLVSSISGGNTTPAAQVAPIGAA
jgi:hypothetical protein